MAFDIAHYQEVYMREENPKDKTFMFLFATRVGSGGDRSFEGASTEVGGFFRLAALIPL
jgi:hypothetical protein